MKEAILVIFLVVFSLFGILAFAQTPPPPPESPDLEVVPPPLPPDEELELDVVEAGFMVKLLELEFPEFPLRSMQLIIQL